MSSTEFLDALRSAVGAAHVLVDGDLSSYEVDWRKRYRGRALAVVRPGSTKEVAAIVKLCASCGVPVVPQGGNTGLVGGSTPDESGTQVLLSLNRLNRLREIDTANLTMTVEAGCILQNIQQSASERGLLFPLSLAAEGSCTIGGNLASNAGGTQVLRYGNARELCLGLEVVTSSGEVWNGLSGLRKDNTGYDLRDLFIGSEGTLGIITAATLKLHPAPAAVMTAMASVPTLEAAVDLLQRARHGLGADLTGFEVMNAQSMSLVAAHFPQLRQPLQGAPWLALLELSDGESESHARDAFERLLANALDDGVVTDAVVAENLQQSHDLWHLRESIPLAQAEEGLNIKHDVSLPVSRIPAFVAAADHELQQLAPGCRLVNFGHLGDGNLHYNVQAPAGANAAEFLSRHEAPLNQAVYDAVMAHGGSISAEHGIGRLKLEELVKRKSPVALKMMHSVKRALDPMNLMNPGRLLSSTEPAG